MCFLSNMPLNIVYREHLLPVMSMSQPSDDRHKPDGCHIFHFLFKRHVLKEKKKPLLFHVR